MLYCPECKGEVKGTVYKVLRTKHRVDCTACILTIRRRRKCLECGGRWTTLEINKDEFLTLIKSGELK